MLPGERDNAGFAGGREVLVLVAQASVCLLLNLERSLGDGSKALAHSQTSVIANVKDVKGRQAEACPTNTLL